MDHRWEDLIPKELLSPYLKRVMKGSIVYIKEALCQQHHWAKAVPPHHFLCQVGTSGLARHPCTQMATLQMEKTRKSLKSYRLNSPAVEAVGTFCSVFRRDQCLEKVLPVAVNWTHCVCLCLYCVIQVRAVPGAAVSGFSVRNQTAAVVLI